MTLRRPIVPDGCHLLIDDATGIAWLGRDDVHDATVPPAPVPMVRDGGYEAIVGANVVEPPILNAPISVNDMWNIHGLSPDSRRVTAYFRRNGDMLIPL